MSDIIIIGAGPAGLSAALTAVNRGKSVTIISAAPETSNLYKAAEITNYPGVPNVSGSELLGTMLQQAREMGVEIITGTALTAMPMGNKFGVSAGRDYFEGGAVILATGVVQQNLYPGEQEFLGRGVSYCATCDGMLYKGKSVAVIGMFEGAREEAEFLRNIGCSVEYFNRTRARKYEIMGEEKANVLIADGEVFHVDGIFILRSSLAPSSLISGLKTDSGHIAVDKNYASNVPGVFACGDCTGAPYQIAASVGEGNIAALSACKYLDK